MTRQSALRWSLGILGVIFLGALGSGLWQQILQPLLRLLLNVASLGIERFRDDIYMQVARGFNESSALSNYLLLILFTLMAYGFVTGYFVGFFGLWSRRQEPAERPEASVDAAREFLRRLRRFRTLGFVLVAVIVFSVVTLLSSYARIAYINSAVSHYQQVLRVVSPYLQDTERELLESRFAQIRSKEDYVAIVERLEKTAENHGQFVPKFEPW